MKRIATRDGVPSDKKRKKTTSSDIDLVYPFWTDTSVSLVNPPFVTGPLYDDNGYLNVRTSAPIQSVGSSLSLVYDNSLALNGGKLGVKIDPNGPLDETDHGLSLAIGNGLDEDEFTGLTVKPDPNGPIEVSSSGVSVVYDPSTLTVVEMTPNSQKTMKVLVNPDGAIATEGGLGVKFDTDALEVTEEGLSIKIKENGPITIEPDAGLDIDIDSTLVITQDSTGTNNLCVNLSPTGCIGTSSSGIRIQYDENSFTVSPDNKLTLNSSMSTCVFRSGDNTLNNYSSRLMRNIGTYKVPCTYYASIVYGNNVSYGTLVIRVKASDASYGVPQKDPFFNLDPVLTFWLCRDIESEDRVNFSVCSNNSYSPDSGTVKKFITPTYSNCTVDSTDAYFLLDINKTPGQDINGMPVGTQDLENIYSYKCRFSLANVKDIQSTPQLVFTIALIPIRNNNSTYLFSETTQGDVTIGPIPFWYFSNPSS